MTQLQLAMVYKPRETVSTLRSLRRTLTYRCAIGDTIRYGDWYVERVSPSQLKVTHLPSNTVKTFGSNRARSLTPKSIQRVHDYIAGAVV